MGHTSASRKKNSLFLVSCMVKYVNLAVGNLMLSSQRLETFMQVPSAGILSDGTAYYFFKCDHQGLPKLVWSELMVIKLQKGMAPEEAINVCKTVLGTMIHMFKAQKDAIANFEATRR